MKFKNLLKNSFNNFSFEKSEMDTSTITVYSINEYNLEGIKILFDNCKKVGGFNNNSQIATVDPTLWLGQFLDKHFDKISYISSKLEFNILRFDKDNKIVNKKYSTKVDEFKSDEELDHFFNQIKFKTIVVFSIIKCIDLVALRPSYKLRYSDITEEYEERDNKVNEILK